MLVELSVCVPVCACLCLCAFAFLVVCVSGCVCESVSVCGVALVCLCVCRSCVGLCVWFVCGSWVWCDEHCELHDSVNHLKVQRKLLFRVNFESMFSYSEGGSEV